MYASENFEMYLQNLSLNSNEIEIRLSQYSDPLMEELSKFRKAEYKFRNQDYLLSSSNFLNRNFEFDQKSMHIVAIKQSHMVGAIRISKYPFELNQFIPNHIICNLEIQNHVEFSRLVVSSSVRDQHLAKNLIASACIYGKQIGASGVVAICRTPQRRMFDRLGLTPLSESFLIPERGNGLYWLVHGTWQQIAEKVGRD